MADSALGVVTDVPLDLPRTSAMLRDAYKFVSSQDVLRSSDGQPTVLETLTKLSLECTRLLDSLPAEPGELRSQEVDGEPSHLGLPHWARAVLTICHPQDHPGVKESLEILSLIVAGFYRIGLEASTKCEGFRDYSLINMCWKTVMLVLTNKLVSSASSHIPFSPRSDFVEKPSSCAGDTHFLPMEIAEVVDVLLRLTAVSLCEAVLPQTAHGIPEPDTEQQCDPGQQSPDSKPHFKQQVMVAKFFQNHAVRLAVMYPEAILQQSLPLLTSLTCSFSSLLRKGGVLTEECRAVMVTVMGGHLVGLIISLLSSRSSKVRILHSRLLSVLWPSQYQGGFPREADCDAEGTAADTAVSTESGIKCLQGLATFVKDQGTGVKISSPAQHMVPLELETGGRLLVLARCLEGSRSFEIHVLDHFVSNLPALSSFISNENMYEVLASQYLLPVTSRKRQEGPTMSADEPVLFQLICSGSKVLATSVLVSTVTARHKEQHPSQLSVAHDISSSGPPANQHLWIILQRFMLQSIMSSCPTTLELSACMLKHVLKLSCSSLGASILNSLLLVLGRGLAAEDCLLAEADMPLRHPESKNMQQNAPADFEVVESVSLFNTRLATAFVDLLDSCPRSVLDQFVPGFLRRRIKCLKGGDSSMSTLDLLRKLLECGLSRSLELWCREDYSSLLQHIITFLDEKLEFVASYVVTDAQEQAQRDLFRRFICTLNCVAFALLHSSSSSQPGPSDLQDLAQKLLSIASLTSSEQQQDPLGNKRSRDSFEEHRSQHLRSCCFQIIPPALVLLTATLRPGVAVSANELQSLESCLFLLTTQPFDHHGLQQSTTRMALEQGSLVPSLIWTLMKDCAQDFADHSKAAAMDFVCKLQRGSPITFLIALQWTYVQECLRGPNSESSAAKRLIVEELVQRFCAGEGPLDGQPSKTQKIWQDWWETAHSEIQKAEGQGPPPLSAIRKPTVQALDLFCPLLPQRLSGLLEKVWRACMEKDRHAKGIDQAGVHLGNEMRSQSESWVKQKKPSTGTEPLGQSKIQHLAKENDAVYGGSSGVLGQLDIACSALEDAASSLQESEKVPTSLSEVIERVQEAEGTLRKLKSICRRSMV